MKKIFALVVLAVFGLILTGCWPAEVGVTTVFNADGSGTRTFVIDIMDEDLADGPIINPDDPDQDEGKGNVENNPYIDGGVIAIQEWLEDNSPEFITVHEPKVDGYHRYFTMSFDYTSFDDFLDKYAKLVNLSDTMSWDDFDDSEKPNLKVEGFLTKTMTYTESAELMKASMDWAVTGIWNDIYNDNGLGEYIEKENIWVLANVKFTLGDGEFKEERHYDADAEEGDLAGNTGKIVFVETTDFSVTGNSLDVVMVTVLSVAGVLVLAGAGVLVFFLLKKKPV